MFVEPDLSGCTVWCGMPNLKRADGLHCNEVIGHGKDGKKAFEVISEKFQFALKGTR
jgi:hypothetical protein